MANVYQLQNSILNLNALREEACSELVGYLQRINRKDIAIVLDPQLTGCLNMVIPYDLLLKSGVSNVFKLDEDFVRSQDTLTTYLYICRPRLDLMKYIAGHIQEKTQVPTLNNAKPGNLPSDPAAVQAAVKQRFRFHILFVPRQTRVCTRVLEQDGLLDYIDIAPYESLDLLPLDDDVLSMEITTTFRDAYLLGDRSSLYYVGKVLTKLQSSFGFIPNIRGIGPFAKEVYQLILRMQSDLGEDTESITSEIDTLILVDRQVDMVTPLMTQLTYEGLIDEFYGIRHSSLEIDIPVKGEMKKQKLVLNSNDSVFADIRDLNFAAIGSRLQRFAVEMQEKYKERHRLESVSDMKDFVKKIPHLQEENRSLSNHIHIAEMLTKMTNDPSFRRRVEEEQGVITDPNSGDEFLNYLEECICKKEHFLKILRLLCLYCCYHNGLKQKAFDFFRREILQTYGFEAILTLHNLEQLGLIRPRTDNKNSIAQLSKALNLWVDDVDHVEPTDCAYVYSGYAPLSVRLIQSILQPGGLRGRDELLKSSTGPLADYFELKNPRCSGTTTGKIGKSGNRIAAIQGGATGSRKRKVLVWFVGGVTMAEISALRYLGREVESLQTDFIIGTTSIVTGKGMLMSVTEKVGELGKDLQRFE